MTAEHGPTDAFHFDVAAVGGGIAGLAAAITAAGEGASAVLLEKAPRAERGGNTRFADAQVRFPHDADQYCDRAYTPEEFRRDLIRISGGRASPDLVDALVGRAAETVDWLTALGVEWESGYPHTAGYRRTPVAGGQGLVDLLFRRAEGIGVAVSYETPARELLVDGGRIAGLRAVSPEGPVEVRSPAVVLASGGFQASREMRAAHLGPTAEEVVLRGSRHDTGDGIAIALAVGARPAGQWDGYHAAVIDARSLPVECGVTALYNFQMGIIVDAQGQRFLDEGEDFRDHTYVKFARAIIERAGGKAFCIFDQQAYSRPEFQRGWRPVGPPLMSDTIEGLAGALGLPPRSLAETVRRFNTAVQPGELDFDRLDGKSTRGASPPKSNWALPVEAPPFVALPVTGGITFTFGGLKVDREARVIHESGKPIPGLFAAGELMGELFYDNYPGATSVIRGAVFGRIAGRNAARMRQRP
ncbi:MAG: FAD-dependent tricarballylate dehydrogenase TcuA [Chloroflexi bacterium]|nr:FAD-dependent tricarballylate dehydrogenase TcuA [Chloroflexota bacterium]